MLCVAAAVGGATLRPSAPLYLDARGVERSTGRSTTGAHSRGAWRRRARRASTSRPNAGTVVASTSRRPMPARGRQAAKGWRVEVSFPPMKAAGCASAAGRHASEYPGAG